MTHLRLPLLLAPAAGALLAVSIRYGLWLIVLGTMALVVAVARRVRQDQRRWLPAMLAVRALTSAQPRASTDRNEGVAAAELAVLAKGRPRALDKATELVHHEDDPGAWSLAVSRIVIARDLLGRGAVPGVIQTAGPSGQHVTIWAAGVLACLLGAALTSSEWWLVPLLVTYAGAVVVLADWHDERRSPIQVAAAARADPDPLPDEDGQVAAQLVGLAGGRTRPFPRAQAMMDRWDGTEPAQSIAGRRLELAATLTRTSGVSTATVWRARAAWIAAAVSAAATWLVTG